VGEQVLLKLQPYAQGSVVNIPYPKLTFKYFGSYAILERIGATTYKLQLPEGSLVHLVFHVSQLKPYTHDNTLVFSQCLEISALDIADLTPEKILDRRLVKKGNVATVQVLIQWSGLPSDSATWEDYHVLQKKFQAAVVWGHPVSKGEDLSPLSGLRRIKPKLGWRDRQVGNEI
jgi:hypothetical protein